MRGFASAVWIVEPDASSPYVTHGFVERLKAQLAAEGLAWREGSALPATPEEGALYLLVVGSDQRSLTRFVEGRREIPEAVAERTILMFAHRYAMLTGFGPTRIAGALLESGQFVGRVDIIRDAPPDPLVMNGDYALFRRPESPGSALPISYVELLGERLAEPRTGEASALRAPSPELHTVADAPHDQEAAPAPPAKTETPSESEPRTELGVMPSRPERRRETIDERKPDPMRSGELRDRGSWWIVFRRVLAFASGPSPFLAVVLSDLARDRPPPAIVFIGLVLLSSLSTFFLARALGRRWFVWVPLTYVTAGIAAMVLSVQSMPGVDDGTPDLEPVRLRMPLRPPPPTVSVAWTHPHGDAGRTRFVDTAPLEGTPRLRWETATERREHDGVLASPLGIVAYHSGERLAVLDPDTGAVRFKAPGEPLAILDGALFVESRPARAGVVAIECLDLATGAILHRAGRPFPVGCTVAGPDSLIVGTDGLVRLFAPDTRSRALTLVWTRKVEGGKLGLLATARLVLVNDGLGCTALDSRTGLVQWRARGRAVAANETVVLIGGRRSFGCHDVTGRHLWEGSGSVLALAPSFVVVEDRHADPEYGEGEDTRALDVK
ncbi:MAG TPA: hypothetical protein VFF73_24055, partial [Planctomycetota bacterium]|nr:hypothetical protein [Planctomycetota bacterium]